MLEWKSGVNMRSMVLVVLFVNYHILIFLQDITWLKSITNLPILIKGVLTREDGKVEAQLDNIPHLLLSLLSRIDYKEYNLSTKSLPKEALGY